MFCQNCGKEIPEGSSFCENCGAPVKKEPPLSAEIQTESVDDTPTLRDEEMATEMPFRRGDFSSGEYDRTSPYDDGQPFDEPGPYGIDPDEYYPYEPEPKQRKRPKWFLPVLFVCLAAISVAGGMFAASVFDDDDGGQSAKEPTATEATESGEGEDTEASDPDEDDGGSVEDAKEQLLSQRVYAARGVGLDQGEEGHTFKSYDIAIEEGAECIEQDVVLSANGTLMVSRDRINILTDREYDQKGVLRLEDVFDRYGDGIIYVIEMKTPGKEATEALSTLIDAYELQERVIFQSFYDSSLRQMHREYPEMPIMCLCDDGNLGDNSFEQALGLDYVDIAAVDYSYDGNGMTRANCKAAHEAGKQFAVWNLDTGDLIREAIDMGVDSYFTREPQRALELESKYRTD